MAFVGKNNDALAELRREKKKLLAEIARFEAERVKGVLRNGKRAWVHRVSEGLEFFNTVLFEVKEEVKGGLVVCASGEGKEGGMVVIVGAPAEVEAMVGKIKGVVSSIKGGGKGERWQGKLLEWKKGELEALRKLM
jgi:misacylated tRNA(Ala) deacylase